MARGPVNHRAVVGIFAIVCTTFLAGSPLGRTGSWEQLTDQDCPKIDEDKESDVGDFLQWEDKWKDMIRNALRKPV